jgi:hypothetical protein
VRVPSPERRGESEAENYFFLILIIVMCLETISGKGQAGMPDLPIIKQGMQVL